MKPRRAPVAPAGEKRRVLLTGATGNIGSFLAQQMHETYDLRLLVRSPEENAEVEAYGEVLNTDLSNLAELKTACEGIDTVVHMAGDPKPSAVWQDLLDANIIGTYNMMVAAKAAGCRRLIYASSIHAVGGYPSGVQVKPSDPVNPGDLYGVSKCFGEALGRYMAEQEGLEVIVLRIGAFGPREKARKGDELYFLDSFVSRRDLTHLVDQCIKDESLQFAIFNALSNNSFLKLDITDVRELVGYEPQDDFFKENPVLAPLAISEKRSDHNVADTSNESGLREELSIL
ncbi:MAG TPA: NAD(P)-dependent oxidoreductase [Chthoniobacterales bacterium]